MTKLKIPKRIAGVKLDKKLRKRGNELLAMADTPQGRQRIAMGLSMATAAASVALRKRTDAPPAPPEPPRPPASADTAEPGKSATAAQPAPPLDPDKIAAMVGIKIESAISRFVAGLQKG